VSDGEFSIGPVGRTASSGVGSPAAPFAITRIFYGRKQRGSSTHWIEYPPRLLFRGYEVLAEPQDWLDHIDRMDPSADPEFPILLDCIFIVIFTEPATLEIEANC
jgi:hypothetical protein